MAPCSVVTPRWRIAPALSWPSPRRRDSTAAASARASDSASGAPYSVTISRAGRSVATGEGTEFTCARTGAWSRVSSSITRISMFPPGKGAARLRSQITTVLPQHLRPAPAAREKGKAYTNRECDSQCHVERPQLSHGEERGESARRTGDDVHVQQVASNRHADRCQDDVRGSARRSCTRGGESRHHAQHKNHQTPRRR